MEEKRYIKLFNQGYFLSKNEPKVFSKLLKAVRENKEVYQALKAGEAEHKKEYFKAKNKRRDAFAKGDVEIDF